MTPPRRNTWRQDTPLLQMRAILGSIMGYVHNARSGIRVESSLERAEKQLSEIADLITITMECGNSWPKAQYPELIKAAVDSLLNQPHPSMYKTPSLYWDAVAELNETVLRLLGWRTEIDYVECSYLTPGASWNPGGECYEIPVSVWVPPPDVLMRQAAADAAHDRVPFDGKPMDADDFMEARDGNPPNPLTSPFDLGILFDLPSVLPSDHNAAYAAYAVMVRARFSDENPIEIMREMGLI